MALPVGTFVNMLAVIAGSLIGVGLRNSLPEKYKRIIFQGIGLFTIILGVSMALEMQNPLIIIFSLIIGGLAGVLLGLEELFEDLSNVVKEKLNLEESRFTEGLISAFLIFCVGSMTILGSISEGMTGDNNLLITKSVLDGFTSIALASTFGVGVMFSVVPMLIFQGGLTVLASVFGEFITETMVDYLSWVGGVLILGIGINLLEIKRISVTNLLPALGVVVLLVLLFA